MYKGKNIIVAIDGPAASGKSTIAKSTAVNLGFDYLDTGAMYRAVTLSVLDIGADLLDEAVIAKIAGKHKYYFEPDTPPDSKRIYIDGKDVSGRIRAPEVSAAVSAVSRVPQVRRMMVKAQRDYAHSRNVVVEGRDIGTVVFPDAALKVFLVASPQERARRRQIDLREQGVDIDIVTLERQIIARDDKDKERDLSPLVKAQDAIMIDTTEKSIPQVIDEIIAALEDNIGRRLA